MTKYQLLYNGTSSGNLNPNLVLQLEFDLIKDGKIHGNWWYKPIPHCRETNYGSDCGHCTECRSKQL